MPKNPRNIDSDDGIPAKASQGNAPHVGGDKDVRRLESEQAAEDPKAKGREGQAKGSHTHGRGG